MRILVVGGTRFVGRFLVAEAVQRGHEVTVLHRGNTCAGAPDVEHLHANRDEDLSALADRTWDATVDTCAYWPAQVHLLADALGERGGRHLLVSTVSVYGDLPRPGMGEDAPLQEPLGLDGERPAVTPQAYGRLKVGCEQVAAQRYGDDLLVVRPTYLVGPHDHTGRFPAWVRRLARGGVVLTPGPADAPFQYLDARDLAAFAVSSLERGTTGTLHAAAPPITWADLISTVAEAVGPDSTTASWTSSAWLVERGVTPRELPLWTGSDEPEPMLALDPARAVAEGLSPRPLAQTAVDTQAWLEDPDAGDPPVSLGLDADREARLLAEWKAELSDR